MIDLSAGLDTYEDFEGHLGSALAGVMVGRAVCAKPWYWATVDSQLYGAASDPQPHRRALLHDYSRWAEAEEARHPQRIRRLLLSPALNLFSGEPYGKKFRAAMDTRAKDETLSFSQLVLGAA